MVFSNDVIVATILVFFCLGYLFNNLLRNILESYHIKEYKKEINKIFQNILDNIYASKTTFGSRVNNNVTITTDLPNVGVVNILYLMDKKDIAIFKGDSCIHTSDSVNEELIGDISLGIDIFYKSEISDVVNALGMTFSRNEFESRFGVKVEDVKNGMFKNLSDIDKIKKQNQFKFDIDEILDRINSFGIENLTDAEKEFLDNYNSNN